MHLVYFYCLFNVFYLLLSNLLCAKRTCHNNGTMDKVVGTFEIFFSSFLQNFNLNEALYVEHS